MPMKSCKYFVQTFLALVVAVCGFLLGPVTYAGNAVILMPAEDTNAPEGSQIPQRRIEEVEAKSRAVMKEMRQNTSKSQEETVPQDESGDPKGTEPGSS